MCYYMYQNHPYLKLSGYVNLLNYNGMTPKAVKARLL